LAPRSLHQVESAIWRAVLDAASPLANQRLPPRAQRILSLLRPCCTVKVLEGICVIVMPSDERLPRAVGWLVKEHQPRSSVQGMTGSSILLTASTKTGRLSGGWT